MVLKDNIKVGGEDFAVGKDIEEAAAGFRVKVVESTDSTNTLLRALAESGAAEGEVIIARRQSAGRGRIGRSFFSPDGGLYMSVLLKPAASAASGGHFTAAAAVAVAEAISAVTTAKPYIKWVNDLYINGKKVCGILTESAISASGDSFEYVIIGIGLNVYEPSGGFPTEISDTATALYRADEKVFGTVNKLAAEILKRLALLGNDPQKTWEAYRDRCFVIGKSAVVARGNEEYSVRILGLDRDYRLIVKTENGEVRVLSSGEIRLKQW